MKRREFITLLGCSAAAWPLVARAQQPERMRRIGVLMGTSADEPESQIRLAAFLQGLQEAGWAVGRNARIEYRWAAGDRARLRPYAEELVALGSDVVLAGVGATYQALQRASRTVPIVFAQAIDPVGAGIVASSGPAGPQRYRIYPVRIQLERKMARAAQGGPAARDTQRRAPRLGRRRWYRTMGGHSGRGVPIWSGAEPDRAS